MRPLVIDSLAPGCDSYVPMMPRPPLGVARSWHYNGLVRSFAWRKGGTVKGRSSFTGHLTRDSFAGVLDDAARAGIVMPSSYGAFFHARYNSPRLSGAVRRATGWEVPGGWEALLVREGKYPGAWHRYDIRSAYLWAMREGLPETKTYAYTEKRHSKLAACYLMQCEPCADAPYPYCEGGKLPACDWEIDAYGLKGKIFYGVTWTANTDVDAMDRAITQWPQWKHISRAFWGRWIGAPLECRTYDKLGNVARAWQLPSVLSNPIWAHLIIGRVRYRVWQVVMSGPCARVYIDSVTTQTTLKLGDSIGDWRIEETYNGINVQGINHITSLGEASNDRQ